MSILYKQTSSIQTRKHKHTQHTHRKNDHSMVERKKLQNKYYQMSLNNSFHTQSKQAKLKRKQTRIGKEI